MKCRVHCICTVFRHYPSIESCTLKRFYGLELMTENNHKDDVYVLQKKVALCVSVAYVLQSTH
jgi:hypothetical protein